jgi:flagellum-specific ATP synthase
MSRAFDLIDFRNQRISTLLHKLGGEQAPLHVPKEGTLVRMIGLKLEAAGCQAAIGSRCQIISPGSSIIEAEVVGFSQDRLLLMPEGKLEGIQPGARVIPLTDDGRVAVGGQMLGRVFDGAGKTIDSGHPLVFSHSMPLHGESINPLRRQPIRQALDVGVRTINAMMTIGKGQRLGLFAGSGVGKSTLLGMLTRNTEADVVVVALVGERGREVREFIDNCLGESGLSRAIVVATPADDPPLKRVHGAWRATAIAEYFRSQGKHVLLLMDSLTRFAQAQREIGLAIGEPPVTKGYPPSVFSLLPKLIERAGNGLDTDRGGSITAIYTVLVEGDDHNDPVTDAARAILDGHIVLSRGIAEAGIFPAIDIEASISRSMSAITTAEQRAAALELKKIYSTYQQNKDLINIGAYERGSDPQIDRAIRYIQHLQGFVQQGEMQRVDMPETLAQMGALAQLIQGKGGEVIAQ